MKIEQLDAVFFDFDGVILDSTNIKTEAFKALYAPYGQQVVEKVINHHLEHGGVSRVEKIAFYHDRFLNAPLSAEELSDLCLHFSDRVKQLVIEAVWIPGAQNFLETYHTATNLYVVSGTPETELQEIIEKRKMRIYFKQIMGSPTKKPIHVKHVIKKRNFRSYRCVFIGDALTDYNTARETGVHFIGIQGEIDFPDSAIVLPDCTCLLAAIEAL